MPNRMLRELRRIASALVDPKERRGSGVRRLIGATQMAECADHDAYFHFALVAAFNAYVAMGGTPEASGAFPWAEHREQLTERARKRLTHDIQGAHTTYGDLLARRTPRYRLPWLRWDSWGPPTGRRDTRARRPTQPTHQPERDLQIADLDGLLDAVRGVLTEYEGWVLTEHYARGRTLRDIAEDVAAGRCPELRYKKCKRNYGDGLAGIRRAEKQVQQTLQRALARAGERLATEWRTKAEDARCV